MSRLYGLVLLFLVVYILSSFLFVSLVEERLIISGKREFMDLTETAPTWDRARDEIRRERSSGSTGSRTSSMNSVKYTSQNGNSHIDTSNTPFRLQLQKSVNLPKSTDAMENAHRAVRMSRPVIGSCVNESEYILKLQSVFVKLNHRIYLYSAFYDAREAVPYIRIIAAVDRVVKSTLKLWCHYDKLETTDRNCDYVTQVAYYQMCENHYKPLGGWILSCPLPNKYIFQGRQPCSVEVSSSNSSSGEASSVKMSILTTERSGETQIDFAVCVPPLFGKIRIEDLVQFVELTRILGANYFVFYVYDVNPEVKPILSYYMSKGIATVLQWSVPTKNAQDIWYHGQLLSINDCLYRHMSTVDYLIFNDLDEFLVPHVPQLRSWRDIAEATTDPNTTCGMTFKSAFFDIALRTNRNFTIGNLTVLDITSRTKHFSKPRNKVMVQPYRVFEMGIHHVSRPWPDAYNYSVVQVSTQVAFIHHYRPCVTSFKMNCFEGATDSTVVDLYGDEFYRRYLQTKMDLPLEREDVK